MPSRPDTSPALAAPRGRHRRWRKAAVVLAVVGAVAASSQLVGLPSTLSIGGGVALIAFGSLWPMLWLMSLLPADRIGFVHHQYRLGEISENAPLITILAPARNEEPVAERLVAQFQNQDYANWHLVVIANNCTDDTAEVARRVAHGDPRISVIEATFENGVKADALNLALETVEGDVVLELDSDNQVPSDLLSKIARAFSDPAVMAVQTQIRAYNARGSLLATLQDLEFLIYSEIWNRGRAALGLGSSIGGTGFAARTRVLKSLNGWTRDLVEDFEMHTRLVAHGVDVTYLPDACVYDEKPITWDALIRQRKRWIRGHLEIAARRSRGSDRLGWIDQFYLYSPLFVALSMSLFVMGYLSVVVPNVIRGYAYFSPWFWLASLGVMVAAIGTTVIRSRDYRLLPLIPLYLLFFSFHWMVVFCSAVFPVSWAASKTVHGVKAVGGIRSWLGVDGTASARMFLVVLLISVAWMGPLMQGLQHAPSPVQAPVLQAGRSIAIAVAGAAGMPITDHVVQGRVVDGNGSAIASAVVTLRDTAGSSSWTARTNASGDFLIATVPPGQYSIEIAKSGWGTARTQFSMDQGGVWVNATLYQNSGGVVIVPIPY